MEAEGNGPSPTYRRGVGIMMLNAEGKVFVAQRIDATAEAWQMPQGGIHDGENPRAAALRELREEVGTDKVEVIAETEDWLAYDLPSDLRTKVWDGRYRGQEQKWFVVRFTGDDTEIDLDTEDPEFSAWTWTTLEALPALIVPFKRALYEDLVARFGHLAKPERRP